MTEISKNIAIEELSNDVQDLNLKKGDFIAVYPVDFYSGTGIYGMEIHGRIRLARCIEMVDGKIQVQEIGTMGSSTLTTQNFHNIVKYKVFAKVSMENNLPGAAISEFKNILLKRS